jgi:SNF2 family DNA or RNA helicase
MALAVPPGLTLLPHQQEGIRFALYRLRNHRGAMFGDVMGLGKTIEAIGTANAMGSARILVVCPASVLLTWRREIWKWQTLDTGDSDPSWSAHDDQSRVDRVER